MSLKVRVHKHGIVVSRVIRRALEVEVAVAEDRKLREEISEIRRRLKGRISTRDVVKAVKEARKDSCPSFSR